MRFAITAEHREFFGKHNYIEFDDLFTEEEAVELKTALDKALAKRLAVSVAALEKASPLTLYLHGRNLWKEDPFIKKMVLKSKLAETASSLFKKKPLRLAYAQFLRTGYPGEKPYSKLLTLQECSSFQPVTGCVLIRLNDIVAPSSPYFCPVPEKIGSGIFIGSNIPIALHTLFEVAHLGFLLIVYSPDKTLYTLEARDPLTHALKKEGMAFGDALRNDMHPIVFRG